ncbi:N-acetylglucosamine-6-phosphate deacetylase [Planctomycetes bacterium Pan216]|uniref:N-acetylglucosamine-6-phosphate deacetylase n=1 Tax=Kolteria novifilia TaxID=2527975 RepID=A0A518B5H7_9BACT|nr:N-acetylglucosamine-6-phosphate deacetylase [Planctomycetes bacterium Pan216]
MTTATSFPGFVDLQVNGYLGIDFSSPDLTEEDCEHACREVLAHGTSAFLPTMITSPWAVYERNLPLIAQVMERPEFVGRLLGIHLEGPFLSPEPGAVGAHDQDLVQRPSTKRLERLLELAQGKVNFLTIAADAPGAEGLTRFAVDAGIAVSLGHHMATNEDLDRLAFAGASALTHLGNGVPNLLDRHRNPIWAGLANDALTAMVIADGHHLPKELLKIFLRVKGIDNFVVVSDAAPIAGCPPGRYRTLSNEVILEPSGRLHNPSKGCLVGSSATMLDCMNVMASLELLSEQQLRLIGFENPLRLLSIDPESLPTDEQLFYEEETCQFHLLEQAEADGLR